MKTYHSAGHSYLVCPRLLEMDSRHGEHWSKGPPCRHGRNCHSQHEHESLLVDPEGHTVNDFYWLPGCRPHTPDEHPRCDACGRRLVHSDLDDLYADEHLTASADGVIP